MPSWIYVRHIELPYAVKAVTIPNADDTYNIFINTKLDVEAQMKALHHELKHIKQNHHYDRNPVALNEQQAG